MFAVATTSLGELDACDQLRVRSFLQGRSCKEQFEESDESGETTPPDWLVSWSNHWKHDMVLTIEGDDWWMCEWRLVMDNSSHEAWISVYQGVGGDEGAVFKRIAEDADQPRVEAVCECVLSELELLGDAPLRGSLTVGNPQWLPQEQMETLLKRLLNQHGMTTVDSLLLSAWILREYRKLS